MLLLQLVSEVVIQVEAIQPSIIGNKLVLDLLSLPKEFLPIHVVLFKILLFLKLFECRECYSIIFFNVFLRYFVQIIPWLFVNLMGTIFVGQRI